MEVLILGGTVFLSKALASESLSRGHSVTCVSRGQTGTEPPRAKAVHANRADGLAAYKGLDRPWDAVIDVATNPLFVTEALKFIGPSSRHWTYVSSCSVYADQNVADSDESAATVDPLTPGESSTPATYAAAKAASEAACTIALGDRLHLCRPGLIGGADDPSDRTGYWPARFALDRGHPVVVPDDLDRPVQVLDVQDLARWIVDAAEQRLVGTMNAVGQPIPLEDALLAAQNASSFEGETVAMDGAWLLEQGVEPWAGNDSLPLWIPPGLGFDGFCRRSGDRALAAGLRRRPIDQTMAAALATERHYGLERPRSAGLTSITEASLLLRWTQHREGLI
jgi:nucleoside-diphosphate-sugar epimerase